MKNILDEEASCGTVHATQVEKLRYVMHELQDAK